MTPLDGIAPEDFPRKPTSREDAARWYLERGIPVFAVCAPKDASCTGEGLEQHKLEHGRGKIPTRAGWTARKTPDEKTIVNDWRNRQHNIAMPCGRMGKGYVVALDVDGDEGARALADAEAALGALPPTLLVRTGRGVHRLFTAPADATDHATVKGSLAGLRYDRTTGVFETGTDSKLDLRGEGGYVVAPGSTHASGATYTATGTTIAALPPPWWDALPRAAKKAPSARSTAAPAPSPARYRAALDKALSEDLDAIVLALDGTQNDEINATALRPFRLAIGAQISLENVASRLMEASLAGGHPEARARATIESARRAAEAKGPPDLRERERRAPGRGRRAADELETDDGDGESRKREATRVERDGRPVIELGVDLHRMVAQAERALGAHPAVYARHGLGLAHVISAPETHPEAGAAIVENLPRALVVTFLAETAQWIGVDRRGDERQTRPDESVVSAIHAAGTWPSARYLAGLSEAPVLRPDGSIASERGYDQATGVFVTWNGTLDLLATPTREDARRACDELLSIFEDFQFAGEEKQGLSRAAVLAAILTPLARSAVDGPVPMFMFAADGPNAGKTLMASTCGAIATGRVPGVRQFTIDDDEMTKRLTAIAASGCPVALFDNIRSVVAGSGIEQATSAGRSVTFRVLGKSEERDLPWRTVLYLTANGAVYNGDNTKRVIEVVLRGRNLERGSEPTYRRSNLTRYVIDERPALLRAAFTILRAHHLAGRPHTGAKMAKFEQWSRIVAAAVHWSFGYDPVMSQPDENANHDANVARDAAIAWWNAYATEPVTIGKMLADFRDRDRLSTRPGLVELRDAIADLTGAPDPTKLTPRSVGRRIGSQVAKRPWIIPDGDGAVVSIDEDGKVHGSLRYRASHRKT